MIHWTCCRGARETSSGQHDWDCSMHPRHAANELTLLRAVAEAAEAYNRHPTADGDRALTKALRKWREGK